MQTAKNGLSRLAGWVGRHKKIWIALAVVLVLAAGVFVWKARARTAVPGQTVEYVRTVTLSRGSLDDVVSATGTVESADVSTVTTDLKYTVQQVLVAVGDSVQEGDVICTLDTSELESQIEKLKENLADQTAQAQKQYDQAAASRDEAKYALDEAYTSQNRAQSSYDSAKSAYDTIVSQLASYQSDYDAKLAAYQQALLTNGPGTADSSGQTQETDAVAPAADPVADAKAALDAAESALNTMKEGLGYTAAQQAYTSAQQTLSSANSAYEQAQKTYETAQEAVDTAAETLENSGESDELDSLYEQVDACTLRAKTAGKVTALDATVGSQPGATVATIQNTGSLQIRISIPEYDIENVSVGLPVRITTDVTDETFTGTLTQIAPTATGGGSSSSQFAAVVSVDGSPEALRIGTNASVEIILSSTEDVFTVPLDAIGQDESGQDVVYLQTGTDENGDPVFAATPVTVGATNDYYAEVSGDGLTEGAVVRAAADESQAVSQITLPAGAQTDGEAPAEMPGGMAGGMTGAPAMGGQGGGRGEMGGGAAPAMGG